MRVLFIGDIVAGSGRKAVKQVLPNLIKEKEIDYVIANAENLSHGRGVTEETISEMMEAGVNYFTSGDHLFWQKGTEDIIDDLPILRPANYPAVVPGIGHKIIGVKNKENILLINLMGRTSFSSTNSYLDDPFLKLDEILAFYKDAPVDNIIVDFHGDATSEKYAFAFYVDGRTTAVVGTHTHVPTCDNMVLPKGSLYVTDVGMTGNIDSVLGVKKEIIINLFLTAQNQRFDWEDTGRKAFRSVLLDISKKTIDRVDVNI